MTEEVTSVHEEVVFHGVEAVYHLALVEDDVEKLLGAPLVSFVDVLIYLKLVFLPRLIVTSRHA